jgi:hypothetical protein
MSNKTKPPPCVVPDIPVPYEDDGSPYVYSFAPDADANQIREFFDKYGFVVIRDVLTAQDADATVADMWDILEESSTMKANNPGMHLAKQSPSVLSWLTFTIRHLACMAP